MSDPELDADIVRAAQLRLFDVDHADELARMKARLWGLHALLIGHFESLHPDDHQLDADEAGIVQLTRDVAHAMDKCARKFDKERESRHLSAEERSAAIQKSIKEVRDRIAGRERHFDG